MEILEMERFFNGYTISIKQEGNAFNLAVNEAFIKSFKSFYDAHFVYKAITKSKEITAFLEGLKSAKGEI